MRTPEPPLPPKLIVHILKFPPYIVGAIQSKKWAMSFSAQITEAKHKDHTSYNGDHSRKDEEQSGAHLNLMRISN